MKGKKGGFTLIELMAVVAISSIALLMISTVFIQGNKIFNRTNNLAAIEDEFRNAIVSIERSVGNSESDKVNVTNLELADNKSKELISITDGMKYIEVKNDDGTNSLIELDSTNNKSKVLVSRITKKPEEHFVVNVSERNKIINISMPGITKGNTARADNYSGSIELVSRITKKPEEHFVVNVSERNKIINISMPGITKGNTARADNYSGSIDIKNNANICLEIANEGNSKPEEDEFIASMTNNINIVGDIEFSGSDQHNKVDNSLSIGIGGKLEGNVDGESNIEKDKKLKKIIFDDKAPIMDTLEFTVAENGKIPKITAIPKIIKHKIGDYDLYLVRGNTRIHYINFKGNKDDNHEISIDNSIIISGGFKGNKDDNHEISIDNSIIISGGDLIINIDNGIGSVARRLEVNNSIIYCNTMKSIDNKQVLLSANPIDSQHILNSYAKSLDDGSDSTIGKEMVKIMNNVGFTLGK